MDPQQDTVFWKRNLICTWIGQILSMAGYAAIMPFIPLFIRDKYHIADEKELGVWVSVLTFFGFLSFVFSTPVWGMLADKFGRKLMLLRSYYASVVLFPLLYFAPTVIWLVAIRFFISCFSGSVTAAQTLIVTTTPKEHQGLALGLLSTAVWSGNMIGLLTGSFFVDRFGYFWGFMSCGAMYLVGGAVTHIFVREHFAPPEKTVRKRSFREKIRKLPAAVWVVLVLFVTMSIARQLDVPYVSLFVSRIGPAEKAVRNTGFISLAAAAGGLLSGVVLGRLCDKFSPVLIAVPALLLSAVTMLVQAFSVNLWMLGEMRFAHYLTAGGLEPAFQSLLARLVPGNQQGTLLGVAASLRMVGVLLASALGGGLIALSGSIRTVFIGSGVAFLLLLPLVFLAAYDIKKTNQQKDSVK